MKKVSLNVFIKTKRLLIFFLTFALAMGSFSAPTFAVEKSTESKYLENNHEKINMNLIGRYDVDVNDPQGGLEIVAYNENNDTAYAVDGQNSVLIAVPMSSLKSGEFTDLSSMGYQIDLKSKVTSATGIGVTTGTAFEYGDITSVSISPNNSKLAVSIQEKDYNEQGVLAVFPIDGSEDTLGEPVFIKVGIQPDMAVFAGNDTVLIANEGEPRMGYGINSAGVVVDDPKGSVSIVNLVSNTSEIVNFDNFDSQRDSLVEAGVLMTKGQAPSVDFEPEYIAVSSDGNKAYVALQENNALAVLDIKQGSFTHVFALGFKDHSIAGNEIYLDGSPKTYENLLGAYLPDGISIYENDGKTYILTANEGDAREWSSTDEDDVSFFINEKKITVTDGENEIKKVVVIDSSKMDGLPEEKNVLFGGRSFSMFEVMQDGVKLAYDSGSGFEDITFECYPEWFNASNDNKELNSRSKKKGPEPENVTVGKVGDSIYAFVALERIGGIMAYDITDPTNVTYSNYINTRDFGVENGIGGDSAPEGIAFISASDSPTGKAILIAGCEITGTMPVYELSPGLRDLTDKLVIIHTNDTHGGDVAVEGKSIGTAGVAQLVKDYEAAGAEVLLISAGDAIQGDPLVNLSKGKTAIDFMNLAGYDMMVPGNHEYDFGYDNLQELENIADFPLVTANILDKVTGLPEYDENIIFDTNIGKIGIFGLTTPETLTKANPNNVASLNFLAGEEMYDVAQEQVDELIDGGADYIIAVAHLGTDESSKPNRSIDVLENVEGIDVFIDAHSHSVIDGEKYGETILVQAGTKLNNVGVIIIDKDNIETKLISAKEYNRVDETINAKINSIAAEIDMQLGNVFATTKVLLDGNKAPGVRTQETNLGDFSADAMLWAAKEAVGVEVDAAITNGGGIRGSIAKGDVTMKDMKTVFPFGNTIATVKITGSQLIEVLEASTFITPESLGAFPQVAGLEFTINTGIPYVNGEKFPDSTYYAPANPGRRIKDVKVGGKPIDLNKTYTVATNDFLAAGGDTYYLFKSLESYNTYVALEDALVNYTDEVLGGVITEEKYSAPAGRIKIINEPEIPVASIAVFSDAHYYAPELGTSGAAFEEYLANDRKLIAESKAIVTAAIEKIKASDAKIVLVPGDLTKDGEKISHEQFANLLAELEKSGKKVYVIPGNHDVNSLYAEKFEGDEATPVENVNPKKFVEIYSDFGYAEAIGRDPSSLSYVVEPVEGLWVIGMDSCQYNETDEDRTAGSFSDETLRWIIGTIEEGQSRGKRVIGMAHHGIVEHFEFQNELFNQYVIDGSGAKDDWQEIAGVLADAGMEVVFTGHFHANDIVSYKTKKGNNIYDMETGSLVTYPNPYRLVEITKNDKLVAKTNYITEIEYNTGDKSFQDYAKEFLYDGLNGIAENTLVGMIAQGSTDPQVIDAIKAQLNAEIVTGTGISVKSIVVKAIAAHYEGDEKIDEMTSQILNGLLKNEDATMQMLAGTILSLYNDPAPKDNNETITLREIPEREDDDDDDDSGSGSGTTPAPTPTPVPTPTPTPTPSPSPDVNFGDVGNHWAESLIKEAVARNLFKGIGNNNFEPDRSITRAEIAAVLVRGLNLQAIGTGGFSDINAQDWFSNDISAAFSNGLLGGYEDGTVRPNNSITRQEAMVIIARALAYKGMDINIPEDEISRHLLEYNDGENISEWARQYAAICIKSKIFEGSNGYLRPDDNITRAEAVKIILYMLNL